MKIISFLTASLLLAVMPLSKILPGVLEKLDFQNTVQMNIPIDSKSNGLTVSYTLNIATEIAPVVGSIKDMNIGDVRMIQEEPATFDVVSKIDNKGNPCIEIKKFKFNSNQEKGKSENIDRTDQLLSFTKFCDGKLNYEKDGRSKVTSLNNENKFWLATLDGYTKSEKELAKNFNDMIQALNQSGAQVTENDQTIRVEQPYVSGGRLISIFDKNQFVLMYNGLEMGNEVVKSFRYQYEADSEGRVILRTIKVKSKEQTPIAKQDYIRTKWMVFEDFNISI